MSKQITYMPEIHGQVIALIDQIFQCHSATGGQIPLSSLMQLFGSQIDATDLTTLENRGTVELTRDSATGGRFVNNGGACQFNSNGITIKVPATISGNYLSFTDNFVLDFSPENTVSAGKLFFFVKVQDIDANQNKIDVDVSGDSFDQTIIHGSSA